MTTRAAPPEGAISYEQARDAETARPGAETVAAADAAYERYTALRQDGPDAETQEMEAGS